MADGEERQGIDHSNKRSDIVAERRTSVDDELTKTKIYSIPKSRLFQMKEAAVYLDVLTEYIFESFVSSLLEVHSYLSHPIHHAKYAKSLLYRNKRLCILLAFLSRNIRIDT